MINDLIRSMVSDLEGLLARWFDVNATRPIAGRVMEGWGRVVELTLSYVVVHIWDDRRLILPLSYLLEKPFQSWTRNSAATLDTVLVWTDYRFPLEAARKALKEIIEGYPLWDKRFSNVQVTDSSERAMQIRLLATAAVFSASWDLRCDIRERLLAFIQPTHPDSLPRLRRGQAPPARGRALAPHFGASAVLL